jgi:hypothetical protein
MRKPGTSHLQMVWIYLILTLSFTREADLFTLLRIAPPKSSHMIRKIMPGMMSNGSTPL